MLADYMYVIPRKKNFSSSWFPVTCYGRLALLVCKELNVNILPVTDDYSRMPVFNRLVNW